VPAEYPADPLLVFACHQEVCDCVLCLLNILLILCWQARPAEDDAILRPLNIMHIPLMVKQRPAEDQQDIQQAQTQSHTS